MPDANSSPSGPVSIAIQALAEARLICIRQLSPTAWLAGHQSDDLASLAEVDDIIERCLVVIAPHELAKPTPEPAAITDATPERAVLLHVAEALERLRRLAILALEDPDGAARQVVIGKGR